MSFPAGTRIICKFGPSGPTTHGVVIDWPKGYYRARGDGEEKDLVCVLFDTHNYTSDPDHGGFHLINPKHLTCEKVIDFRTSITNRFSNLETK